MSLDLNSPLPRVKLMSVEDPNRGTSLIGGKMSGVVNWNDIRYPQMYTTYRGILSNFWIPQRVGMTDDVKQWESLGERTRDAFIRNIAQLATLDSKQTAAVTEFSRYLSEPTYRPIAAVIAQQEAVHNESYSYVLSSLVPLDVQNKAFEDAKSDPIVVKRNKPVDDLYQDFVDNPTPLTFFKALVSCVVLEGLNFYSTFTFFYNLARDQKMLNTSKMINYIQRDEVQHAYFFSQLVRYLLAEHPELHNEENIKFIYSFFIRNAELEIEWSRAVLYDIEGIDLDQLEGYIKNLVNRRLRGLGLENYYDVESNSMPWMIAFDDESLQMTKSDLFENQSLAYKKVDDSNSLDDL
ncbi:Ribonucleoside-diphosphate reductase subunit beta [compost metagenome]